MLKPTHGNMYEWITATWNPIQGRCRHDCQFCYVKRFPVGELRLNEAVLASKLGQDKTLFVCSGTDMFADNVPETWIQAVLKKANANPSNTYLFQTKNPERLYEYQDDLPPKHICCTTIESNRDYDITKAPLVCERVQWITMLRESGHEISVTIEPVLDFDVEEFANLINNIHPDFISIGADSKNHHLPEPTPEKITEFLKCLNPAIIVKKKDNLKRLMEKSGS